MSVVSGHYAQGQELHPKRTLLPKRTLRPNVNYAQGNYDNVISILSHILLSALNAGAKRSEAERRAIWPCFNVATWRKERSDRAIQHICKPLQIIT